jgi:hypothetical protein
VSLKSRIGRLERQGHRRPSAAPPDELVREGNERIAASLEGPALLGELWSVMGRVVEGCPADRIDLPLLRQLVIADDRGREVCCRLSEIAGGLG